MKKIYRPRQNRMLGGVCMGIARYFDIDVTLVRLLWLLLVLIRGAGIIAYIIAWIIIPDESGAEDAASFGGNKNPGDTRTLGLIVVIIGVFLLILKLVPAFLFRLFWPLLIIIIGLLIMFGGLRGNRT